MIMNSTAYRKAKSIVTDRKDSSAARQSAEGLQVPGWFGRWPILGISMVLLGGLSFALLGYNVLTHGPLVQLDETLYRQFLAHDKAASPSVKELMLFGFFLGKQVTQVIIAILTLYFLHKRFWRELQMIWMVSAGGFVVWLLCTSAFDRTRPAEQVGFVITIPSFPSGHVMSAVACYGFLAYLLIPKMPSLFWKWTLVIATLLMVLFDGYSRIYTGNHYLTDVLAGYALAIAWAGLVFTVLERSFGKEN
jgi:undecaprenyl-diphosphatase